MSLGEELALNNCLTIEFIQNVQHQWREYTLGEIDHYLTVRANDTREDLALNALKVVFTSPHTSRKDVQEMVQHLRMKYRLVQDHVLSSVCKCQAIKLFYIKSKNMYFTKRSI